MDTKASLAKTIARRISSLPAPLLQLLNQMDSESYKSVESIELRFNPVIVVAPKTLFEKIMIVGVPSAVGVTLVILIIVYRRPLLHGYYQVVLNYRQSRRKEVYESMGIPIDMYFLPKEGAGEVNFETPYGDIHLVTPLVKTKKRIYSESFVQASQP